MVLDGPPIHIKGVYGIIGYAYLDALKSFKVASEREPFSLSNSEVCISEEKKYIYIYIF